MLASFYNFIWPESAQVCTFTSRNSPNPAPILKLKFEPASVDLEKITSANKDFRYTVPELSNSGLQTVLMCLTAKDAGIKREVHPTSSQFISIVSGKGTLILNDVMRIPLHEGVTVLVPPNTPHEIRYTNPGSRNDSREVIRAAGQGTGSADLKLFTIYVPPLHGPSSQYVKRRIDDIED